MIERQNGDGSQSGVREKDSGEVFRVGSYAGPSGSNTPGYPGASLLNFNTNGSSDTGTAGGLLQWQNKLGYDIIVTSHQLDVITPSGSAGTVSFGQAAASTTSSSNMISGQSVAATGTFNGGALSVKVAANAWITGTAASGTTASMVARAYFTFQPAGLAASGANQP